MKPVWAFDRPFKRVGRTTQRLSPEETHRLMNKSAGRTWDALPCGSFRLENVDRRLIEAFLTRAGIGANSATAAVLENLGLVEGSELSRAAALLFARNPRRYIPDAEVKCARFEGETSAHFADERTLQGDVLSQIDEALEFVQRNISQRIQITGKATRDVIPDYPTPAVREAIVNAVCHRDYAASGTVQVRIYGGRLEVWNPGTLPEGMTYADICGHVRICPHIAGRGVIVSSPSGDAAEL